MAVSTLCCAYRYQRTCQCLECCYSCDKSSLNNIMSQNNEKVIINWHNCVLVNNYGRPFRTKSVRRRQIDIFANAQVLVTDKQIYIKSNPSPFCGMCMCWKICGDDTYQNCCNLNVPMVINLQEDVQSVQQSQPDTKYFLKIYYCCCSIDYSQPSIEIQTKNGGSFTLILKEKVTEWQQQFQIIFNPIQINIRKNDQLQKLQAEANLNNKLQSPFLMQQNQTQK